jgi:chromosome segregation ATPase
MEMKQSIQISAVVTFTLLVVFPLAAMSEVKISLKNGRDIMADSCSDSKDRLVCEKLGGTFEIEKKDILETRGITIEHENINESPVPETVPVGEGQKEADKSSAKRLDEITRRKLELKQEREKLSKEREQLRHDAKKMSTLYTYPQEQADELNKRISDIEERINRFNEEVKKLNAEESSIIEGLNKGK